MRTTAARLVAHGAPIVVEEVELPEPGADEVLVQMKFAGVNPVDRYVALGRVAAGAPLPRTLGAEGVGLVDGSAYVVKGSAATGRDGVWASHAVVQRSALVPVPEGVPLDKAAAMGVAGSTSWRTVVELGAVSEEDRVLVLGASGGVGHVVVTLARRIGAPVWGQVGSSEKADFVRGLGAEHVIVGDAEAVAREAPGFRPTVVLDPLGGAFTGVAIEALAPHGRLVLYGTSADVQGAVPLQQLYRKGLTVFGYGGLIEPDEVVRACLRNALEALSRGGLDVVVDSVLPLERVNEAFERLVARQVKGKLLLDTTS